MAKKILKGHKKVGTKFIPPLVQTLNNMVEVSYINQMLPELIWMGVLIEEHGYRKGIQLVELLARKAFEVKTQEEMINFGVCSKFDILSDEGREKLLSDKEIISELNNYSNALSLMDNLYEYFPLSFLCQPNEGYDESELLGKFAHILAKYWDKFDQPASVMQANVIYIGMINGAMLFAEGLQPDLEAIFEEPESEKGQREKSRVRMGAMMQFMHYEYEAPDSWPRRFWNQGLKNSQCIFLPKE